MTDSLEDQLKDLIVDALALEDIDRCWNAEFSSTRFLYDLQIQGSAPISEFCRA